MIFSILIAVIAALLLVVIIITLKNFNKSEEGQEVFQKIQKKGKSAILKEAEKKLAHDPHNVSALLIIGDIYFSEKDWENVEKEMSKVSKIDITQLQAWDFFFSGWPNVVYRSKSSKYLNSETLEITNIECLKGDW